MACSGSRFESAADETIIAFGSVRNSSSTSDASFGDWRCQELQVGISLTLEEDIVPAMIEVSRGSPNKYEIDKETGQVTLDRVLHSSVYYPGDYGYVPQTLCGDGDPLDILLIAPVEAGTYDALDSGIVANSRVVGLMDMEDESGHDEKLIAVLATRRSTSHITELSHIPAHLQREIQHFFENYKVLEVKDGKPKWARILGWGSKARALEVVAECRRKYSEKSGGFRGAPAFHPFVRVPQCPNLLHDKQCMGSKDGPNEDVSCYVSAGKGGVNSYVYRHDTSYRHYKYTLDMPFPANYGTICQTWDPVRHCPLEILILNTFPLSPECIATVRVIGGISRKYVVQAGETVKDHKILGVVSADPRMDHLNTITDLNPQALSHFCSWCLNATQMMGYKNDEIAGTFGAAEAMAKVRESHATYRKTYQDFTIHNAPNLWCLPWQFASTNGTAQERIYPAFVEASKHTSNQYRFDFDVGVLRLVKPFRTASFWPGNAGFIPQTIAEDGRPVDIIILSNVPLRSCSVVEVRVLGAARSIDEMGPDVRLIGVPKSEPRMKEWADIEQVPAQMRDEIVHFLNAYKDLEPDWKYNRFERWLDANEAMEYVQGAHSRFFLFALPMRRLEKRVQELEARGRAVENGIH